MGKFKRVTSSLESFLLTARWFGDAHGSAHHNALIHLDENFWTVATWALSQKPDRHQNPTSPQLEYSTPEKPKQILSVPKIQKKNLFHEQKEKELPLFFDPLMSGQDMAFLEQARLQSYKKIPSPKSTTQLQMQSQHRVQTTYYSEFPLIFHLCSRCAVG